MLRATRGFLILCAVLTFGGARELSAEVFSCPLPIAIPDRWDDITDDGQFDPQYDIYDPSTTGFSMPGDLGRAMTLKVASNVIPLVAGHYFGVNYPAVGGPEFPLIGISWTRHWFSNCSPYPVAPGDSLQVEPASVGLAVQQEFEKLVVADPNARWDVGTQSVVNSALAISPRIVVIPVHSPNSHLVPYHLPVVKFLKVFVESMSVNSFTVRILDISSESIPVQMKTWGSIKATQGHN